MVYLIGDVLEFSSRMTVFLYRETEFVGVLKLSIKALALNHQYKSIGEQTLFVQLLDEWNHPLLPMSFKRQMRGAPLLKAANKKMFVERREAQLPSQIGFAVSRTARKILFLLRRIGVAEGAGNRL